MKVTTKSCNSSQAGLPNHKIMSFSTSQLFYLFLFLTVFPLAVFNVLWVLGLQQAIASSFFWNFIRLGLFSVLIVRYSNSLFYKCKNRCFHLKDIFSSATLATPFLLNLVSMKFPDTNGDSVTSHLLVTKAVMLGWNPLRGDDSAALIQSSNLLLSQSDLSLGRVETGIGFQAIQAFYNQLFGITSSYTFVNSLFIMSVLFCLIDSRIVVKRNAQNREVTNKASRNICIGILFLMSPIIIQQLFSAYADLAGYALIFTAVVLFLKMHSLKSGDKKLWLTFGVIILVMPTIKLQLVALVIPLVTGVLTKGSLSLIKQTFLQQGTEKHARRGITWQIVIKALFILSLAIFPVGPLAASTLTGNLPLHSDKKWVASTWSGSIPEFMR